MNTFFAKIVAVAMGMSAVFASIQAGEPVRITAQTQTELKAQATQLPQKIIDPRTYQDTTAQIRYVDTRQMVQRGFEILQYNNGKPNAAGYTPHYDPNLHGGNSTSGAYVRIPRTGKDIYGNRW